MEPSFVRVVRRFAKAITIREAFRQASSIVPFTRRLMLLIVGSPSSFVVKTSIAFYEIQKKAKKFDIYVVRIRKSSNHFVDSAPCSNCARTLKKYGFKNIYYSNEDGTFEKKRIKDLDSNHNSYAQDLLNKYIDFRHKY